MASRWRRWRTGRRLAALLEPGEVVGPIERLGLGGWWALTDRALYVLDRRAPARRVALGDIESVRVVAGRVTSQVTVLLAGGGAVAGDLRHDSVLVARLRLSGR